MSNEAHKFENFDDALVGIEAIYAQHTQTLKLYNKIVKTKEKRNNEKEEDAVVKLLEYWKMHFKYEEDLMKLYEYSGFDEHKKEHDRIMNEFSNSQKIFSKGFKYVVSCLSINLTLWIEEHIKESRGEDKKLAKYLRSKGVA